MDARPETIAPNDRGKYGTGRDPKRKRFARTSTAEIVRVLRLRAEQASPSEIARIVGISVQRVSDVLARHESTTDKAIEVLRANSYDAAQAWVRSFDKAVKKGEHRPMRDLLVSVGVISPDPQSSGVVVIVGSGDATIVTSPSTNPVRLPDTPQLPVIDIPSGS